MTDAVDVYEVEYEQRLQSALGPDYELRGLVGRGGFGAVYRAWDRKLEREVAVKALRHDLFPTRMVLDRFQREARAVAKLRHPHILPIYSVGEGDGLAFMIMPFIEGESLAAFLRRGRIDVDEAVRITREVARALEAAHRVGIVHRDVKPENILLEGPERLALLADFGIAKVSDAGGPNITGTGMAVGSPQYMSPEQGAADKAVDARSDVYSLGAVAYEMITGRRTFEASSYQELLVLQFTSEPPPIQEVAPETPAVVADIVMRALARDPAQRWPSAAALESALAATQSSAPAAAAAAAAAERPSWLARRGIILWTLWAFGTLFELAILPLIDLANASENVGMQRAIAIIHTPVLNVMRLIAALALAELVYVIVRQRLQSGRWSDVWRAVFGQPRWWQAWYPRRWRAPDNVWDRMPASMKVMRTIVWLALAAIPVALPLIFVIPNLGAPMAEAGMPLPLPLRIVIAVSSLLQRLRVDVGALGILAIMAVITARRHRIPVAEVIRLLFTNREAGWDSPAGRTLLR